MTAGAGCAWTATRNAAWILLSNFGGTGNGSVGFMVAANSGPQRTGTMTIAGLTFTVTQDGFACPSITVNPPSLPNGFVGIPYPTQNFSASGGTPSYSFSVVGTLPNGLTLVGNVLSGTPTTTGVFNFSIKATDSLGCMGTRAYTVVISGGGANSLMFYPLAVPVRLLETRVGQPGCTTPGAPIAGGATLTQVARNFCGIPAAAKAVTGNVTVVLPGANGFLTLYPSDASQPTVANTNFIAGDVLNNVFTVGLGAADGAFKIFAASTAEVVIDITGYYAPPGVGGLYFHPLPKPIRLLETRAGQPGCFTPGTPMPGGVDTIQQGTTTCDGVTIPATAKALVGNATTILPAANGFITLYPADATSLPLASSGNYRTGKTLNSPFTVGLSPSGQFKI
ncbi:MAG: putative Ig domain-containing protein, partial [Blastocatellia bacterium]